VARTNKKHFILFNNGGIISATTPKDWARSHQEAFQDYSFLDSKSTPTVEVIEKHLINTLGFRKIENNEVVICYPFTEI
jgi:hypothetical protein